MKWNNKKNFYDNVNKQIFKLYTIFLILKINK